MGTIEKAGMPRAGPGTVAESRSSPAHFFDPVPSPSDGWPYVRQTLAGGIFTRESFCFGSEREGRGRERIGAESRIPPASCRLTYAGLK